GVPEERINVLIHPQSIIHSLVTFSDGSELAQLSNPEMTGPISYAIAYPARVPASVVPELDLAKLASLTFRQLDNERFQAINLARKAVREGRAGGAVLHAANEVAVERFCGGSL